jgi:hypothetical protein
MMERSKDIVKDKNGIKSKKLKKRNISNFVDRREERASLRH